MRAELVNELIREKIRVSGKTHTQIAESLGWGKSYFSQIVNSENPSNNLAKLKILNFLGVEAEEFREIMLKNKGI